MESLKNIFHSVVDAVVDNKQRVLMGLLIALGVAGSAMLYQGYRHNCEVSAQRAFADAMKYFDGDVKGKQQSSEQSFDSKFFESAEKKWQESAQVFHSGYEKNSSSSIASMFLTYESECYLRLGDYKKAIDILRQALLSMKNTHLHQEYALKLALILLDASESESKEGLLMLEAMANAKGSIVQDAALYRLGEFYWYKNQFNDVKKYWGKLVTEFADRGDHDEFNSVWAELADAKLQLIESK